MAAVTGFAPALPDTDSMANSSQPMSVRAALRLRMPTARTESAPIALPLHIPGAALPGGEPANVYLPPGFSLAPDGSFRWGTDAYPLLSGDSQQHATKSAQQQWWSSYSAPMSTAQSAVLSSVLNNVLDLRPETAALQTGTASKGGRLPMIDDSGAGDASARAAGHRRRHRHSLAGEPFDDPMHGTPGTDATASAGQAIDATAVIDEGTGMGTTSVPPLQRPLAAETPLQSYYLPADGVPVPVGGVEQPPVSYFSKVGHLVLGADYTLRSTPAL